MSPAFAGLGSLPHWETHSLRCGLFIYRRLRRLVEWSTWGRKSGKETRSLRCRLFIYPWLQRVDPKR